MLGTVGEPRVCSSKRVVTRLSMAGNRRYGSAADGVRNCGGRHRGGFLFVRRRLSIDSKKDLRLSPGLWLSLALELDNTADIPRG